MKIMLFFVVFSTGMYTAVYSQVKGIVTGADGMGLQLVTVEIFQNGDSNAQAASTTDSAGRFNISLSQTGSFRLRVGAVGYETFFSVPFEIAGNTENINLDTLRLHISPKGLEEVVVRSAKPLYQSLTGGMAVNVQNSVMARGSSVLSVLQQSPGVLLDLRNNSLSLNGKSGVNVMLDGRLLNIPMDQVTRLLESMSADDIEKIELLTTPPASYEAEGNAGLINIVRKKNKRTGHYVNVSQTAGYGQGGKSVTSVGIGVHKGSLNLDGNYILSYNRSADNLYGNSYQNFPPLGGQTEVYFHNDNRNTQLSQNAALRMDYQPNMKTVLGMNLNLNQENGNGVVVNERTIRLLPDSLSFFDATIRRQSTMTNWIGSLYLNKKIQGNAEMRFSIDYISYRSSEPTQASGQLLNKEGLPAGGNDTLFSPQQRGYALTQIQIGVFKADFKKVFSKELSLEAGLKGSYTDNSSHSGIESVVDGAWISRPETSTDISLSEVIAAAYGSVNARFGESYQLVAGLRYEFSRTGSTLLHVLFPYLSLSRPHWQFSYSKRIGRPSYRDLSSFITYNDPLSVFTGNPFLKPTITHNLNLIYDNKGYSVSLLYSRDIHPIARWQIVESPGRDLMYIGPQNMDWQNNLTMQLNAPIKFYSWWTMNLNWVGGWKQYRESYTKYPLQKTWFGYSGTITQTFVLPRNYTLEISGWYNSASYYGSTQTEAFGSVNGGIKKILNRNAGTLQFSVTDIFSTVHYVTDYGRLTREAFDGGSHVISNPESGISPVFRLSWFKSFGLQTGKATGIRKGASNDEQERMK